jgi:ParB family chromosome partitioning protein
MAIKKGGLGRGLDALFNENSTDNNDYFEVKLIDVEPNKDQPRKSFDKTAIEELAASIKEHGLLQPIVVKPLTNGTYRIIAGERRWRACRLAGLEKVPVIVKDLGEQEVMEVALIENLQRQDLNPVEEALGYRALIDTYNLTQEEVAVRVGKSS